MKRVAFGPADIEFRKLWRLWIYSWPLLLLTWECFIYRPESLHCLFLIPLALQVLLSCCLLPAYFLMRTEEVCSSLGCTFPVSSWWIEQMFLHLHQVQLSFVLGVHREGNSSNSYHTRAREGHLQHLLEMLYTQTAVSFRECWKVWMHS